jgi:hypothetical protein
VAAGEENLIDTRTVTGPVDVSFSHDGTKSPSRIAVAMLHVVAPLAWYKADAISGTALADSSSAGDAGTLTGSAYWFPLDVSCQRAAMVVFGNEARFEMPESPPLTTEVPELHDSISVPLPGLGRRAAIGGA